MKILTLLIVVCLSACMPQPQYWNRDQKAWLPGQEPEWHVQKYPHPYGNYKTTGAMGSQRVNVTFGH